MNCREFFLMLKSQHKDIQQTKTIEYKLIEMAIARAKSSMD